MFKNFLNNTITHQMFRNLQNEKHIMPIGLKKLQKIKIKHLQFPMHFQNIKKKRWTWMSQFMECNLTVSRKNILLGFFVYIFQHTLSLLLPEHHVFRYEKPELLFFKNSNFLIWKYLMILKMYLYKKKTHDLMLYSMLFWSKKNCKLI